VSRSAVSVVLSGRTGTIRVSGATRERVLAVAAELGYSPHPIAQALRQQRSNIIGFVARSTPHGLFDETVPYILNIEIARAAARRGYSIVEAGFEPSDLASDTALAQALRTHRVDGAIFDSPANPDVVADLHHTGLPIVQLMRPQMVIDTPTVTVEAERGVTAAVNHLVALGHCQIAFIGSSSPHPVHRSRLDIFRDAIARHAIRLPDDYVQLEQSSTISIGLRLAETLLGLDVPPTAILAAGDNLALGVMRALYQANVHVPDAISVVSYDDTLSGYVYPPLTSVAQPLHDVAERALDLLSAELDTTSTPAHADRHVTLPTHLEIRASTAPPSTVERR
jgi:DNA-binding LacI/PurR family transcriptional regulator